MLGSSPAAAGFRRHALVVLQPSGRPTTGVRACSAAACVGPSDSTAAGAKPARPVRRSQRRIAEPLVRAAHRSVGRKLARELGSISAGEAPARRAGDRDDVKAFRQRHHARRVRCGYARRLFQPWISRYGRVEPIRCRASKNLDRGCTRAGNVPHVTQHTKPISRARRETLGAEGAGAATRHQYGAASPSRCAVALAEMPLLQVIARARFQSRGSTLHALGFAADTPRLGLPVIREPPRRPLRESRSVAVLATGPAPVSSIPTTFRRRVHRSTWAHRRQFFRPSSTLPRWPFSVSAARGSRSLGISCVCRG